MFETCTHTHESGSTCKSPAIRGTRLCFQHTPHQPIKRRQPDDYQPFELPSLLSKSGVLVAITVVLNQLAMRRIKRSEADTFMRGFSLLSRLMTQIDESPAAYTTGTTGMQLNGTSSIAPPDEEEVTSESLQKMVDEIADGLGLEMPTLEEMQKLQASMPNGTPEKALEHWISTGRIRPKQPADGQRTHWKMRENSPARNCPSLAQAMNRPCPSAQQPVREPAAPAGISDPIHVAAHAPLPSNPSIHP